MKNLRAKCLMKGLVLTPGNMRVHDQDTTVGQFYKVIEDQVQSINGETYISIIGNSGTEIQRKKEFFQIM